MRILHRTVGKYSGPVIYGTNAIKFPMNPPHVGRAYWLTGQVETGNKMGSIMMADGTGFTIGIDQHIAVYPKELASEDFNAADDQGSAWLLLTAIEVAHGPISRLWKSLEREGWYIAPDGSLRWIGNGKAKVSNRWVEYQGGDLVHGAVIRDTITPKGGVVVKDSREWETAKKWAELFHFLTAHESTWVIQRQFGINHLIHRVRTRKLRLAEHRRKSTMQQAVYGDADIGNIHLRTTLGVELDLALCVFHSYTVNAPSVAFKILERSIITTGWHPINIGKEAYTIPFAKDLLRRIKMSKYGRWDKRWVRTRKAAMDVGWWPDELFKRPTGLMTP